MNVEALQTKYLIIDWEVYTEDSRKDDLVKLWSLVHERSDSTEPTEDKERELWVELKRLFEPDDDDTLWKLQSCMDYGIAMLIAQTYFLPFLGSDLGTFLWRFPMVGSGFAVLFAVFLLLQTGFETLQGQEYLLKISTHENANHSRENLNQPGTGDNERERELHQYASLTKSLKICRHEEILQSSSEIN
ncbi:hypothetical protein Tco_0702966 [Tanacetum coccineum]|uniref:Uncharacterized protein n=1 Tax=Tanacetum coccineum TaxID=301880 RepID=A0ABQ4XXI8_9ASTR